MFLFFFATDEESSLAYENRGNLSVNLVHVFVTEIGRDFLHRIGYKLNSGHVPVGLYVKTCCQIRQVSDLWFNFFTMLPYDGYKE